MTKREREQVVELLRCAADLRADGVGLNGMFDAAAWLDLDGRYQDLGWSAVNTIPNLPDRCVVVGFVDETYRRLLLEAAARVEEGSWP